MTKSKDKLTLKDEMTEFLLYTTPAGEVKVEIFLHDETIWLTQKAIGNLFGKSQATISEHLKKNLCRRGIEHRFNCSEFPNSSN